MYSTEGMKGFFKGNGTNIVKIAPFSAFEFFFYELFKNALCPHVENRGHLTFKDKLMCGGLTGMVASTLTYPLDIVKTYLTVNENKEVKISMLRQG